MRAIGAAPYLLAASAAVTASSQLPPEWRWPRKVELAQEWRRQGARRYAVARADFNGDGKEDEAALVVSTKGPGCALIVILGGGQAPVVLERFEDTRWLDVMGVDVAKPGRYVTVCGKGYGDCKADEPNAIVLERPAIDLFKEGSANSFFLYDAEAKGFRRVWMSD